MWQILILARIFAANIFFPTALKKMLERISTLPQSRKVVLIGWQFLICLSFSVAFAVIVTIAGFESQGWNFNWLWVAAAILGMFNSYACWYQWQAMDISLSKTAVGTQLDDAISIMLGYFFLNESNFFGFRLSLGIALCFAAAFILIGFGDKKDLSNRRLISNVLKYSVIWGVAGAAERFFNLEGLPLSGFLICWYGGALLGITLLSLFVKIIKKEEMNLRLDSENKRRISTVALFVWVSMVLGYMIAKYAPVAIYQPIFLVGEAILPAILGLYYFHEKKEMKPREWLAIAIGLAGVIAVGTSY
jgi:MFS family permease